MASKINDFQSAAPLTQMFGPIAISDNVIFTEPVDLIDGDGPAFAIVSLSSEEGHPTLSGVIEASEDTVYWSAITGASFPAATDVAIRNVTFQRPARYVRGAFTIANVTTPYAISILLGQARKLI